MKLGHYIMLAAILVALAVATPGVPNTEEEGPHCYAILRVDLLGYTAEEVVMIVESIEAILDNDERHMSSVGVFGKQELNPGWRQRLEQYREYESKKNHGSGAQ